MVEQGLFARIPLDDVTLEEARALVDDPSFFESTRISILANFTVRVDEYWNLRVGDHREMVDYLTARGLI